MAAWASKILEQVLERRPDLLELSTASVTPMLFLANELPSWERCVRVNSAAEAMEAFNANKRAFLPPGRWDTVAEVLRAHGLSDNRIVEVLANTMRCRVS